MNKSRRHTFLLALQTAGLLALPLGSVAFAEERLSEADPMAQALGYRDDASRVDPTKSKYLAGSACANCVLYQGKAGDLSGDCPIFHKLVSAHGWCNSYVKKG
jgi:hypothetical protein